MYKVYEMVRFFQKKGNTMNLRLLAGGFVVAALAFTGVAGEPLKSGLPVGGRTSPFHPLNVTGGQKDKKHCLV